MPWLIDHKKKKKISSSDIIRDLKYAPINPCLAVTYRDSPLKFLQKLILCSCATRSDPFTRSLFFIFNRRYEFWKKGNIWGFGREKFEFQKPRFYFKNRFTFQSVWGLWLNVGRCTQNIAFSRTSRNGRTIPFDTRLFFTPLMDFARATSKMYIFTFDFQYSRCFKTIGFFHKIQWMQTFSF